MKRRAAIYVRISQNREDDRAKPERQIESCRKLMEAKGLTEVALYVDDDISAYKAKLRRPQYELLLASIKRGEVDVVVSWHVDRMLRTVKEMTAFIELAETTGTSVESVQGGSIDLGTPAGRMMATILAAVAQAEAELKSERHRLRNDHAVLEGKSTGGPTPFGWQTPQESQAIRDGIKAYLAGETLKSIAKTWNTAGLTTTFGNPWDHDSVRKVLIRPRNAGLVEHRGAIVEGVKAHAPALCTREEWESCRAIADAGKRPYRPPSHLLSNLVRCSNGHKMTAGVRASGKYRYDVYRCHGPGCLVSIRRDHLDQHIRRMVRHQLTFEDVPALAPSATKVVALKNQRSELKAERTEAEALYAEKVLSAQGLKQKVAPIDATIADLDAKIAELEAENAFAKFVADKVNDMSFTLAAQIGQKFDALSLGERRAIVSHLLPTITVLKVGRGNGHLPLDERVTVTTHRGKALVLA